jgi:DNA-binding NarL/FixJ family response regulator
VAEVGRGDEVLSAALDARPDVALLAIGLPGIDGLEAAGRLRSSLPEVRVVMLTTFNRPGYLRRAMEAGAAGFLLKDAPADELVHAVHVVAAGEALLAPSVTRRLIAEFAARPAREPTADPAVLDALTRREREVLSCLGEGLSNADIARRLDMAEATVKTHVSRLLGKLELRSRVQAAVLAQELGV